MKENLLSAPNASEMNKIVLLTDDILQNFNLKKTVTYLLLAVKPQTEVFLRLMDKDLDKSEKENLKIELRKQNWVISRYNSSYGRCATLKAQKSKEDKTLEQ